LVTAQFLHNNPFFSCKHPETMRSRRSSNNQQTPVTFIQTYIHS